MATETVANDAVFINLAIALFCLVANGFYVAAEFAIVKCKPLRIDQLSYSR
jgi:CBS domain containing-hemolysin-like protein